jgi:hypothetical protein
VNGRSALVPDEERAPGLEVEPRVVERVDRTADRRGSHHAERDRLVREQRRQIADPSRAISAWNSGRSARRASRSMSSARSASLKPSSIRSARLV